MALCSFLQLLLVSWLSQYVTVPTTVLTTTTNPHWYKLWIGFTDVQTVHIVFCVWKLSLVIHHSHNCHRITFDQVILPASLRAVQKETDPFSIVILFSVRTEPQRLLPWVLWCPSLTSMLLPPSWFWWIKQNQIICKEQKFNLMSLCWRLSQGALVDHVRKFVNVNVQTHWTLAQYHTMTLTEKKVIQFCLRWGPAYIHRFYDIVRMVLWVLGLRLSRTKGSLILYGLIKIVLHQPVGISSIKNNNYCA